MWSFHVVVLQRTTKKCTKNYNTRAKPLFWSFKNLLFSDVPDAVVVFLNSLLLSFSTSRRHSRIRSPSCLPVSPMRKLCSRWRWLRYRWNDKWSWWIAWVPIFSQRYEWKDMFCILRARILKFRVDHFFGMHFWLKSYLCFCRVSMKLKEVEKRFY